MNDLVKELCTTFPACEELLKGAQSVVVVAVKWDNALDSPFTTWCYLNLAHNRPALQPLATLYPDHFSTSNRQQVRRFIGDEQRWMDGWAEAT
jgi:hypothetical protein